MPSQTPLQVKLLPSEHEWREEHLTAAANPRRALAATLIHTAARRASAPGSAGARLFEGWQMHLPMLDETAEEATEATDGGRGSRAGVESPPLALSNAELQALLRSGGAALVEASAAHTKADHVLLPAHCLNDAIAVVAMAGNGIGGGIGDEIGSRRGRNLLPLSLVLQCVQGQIEPLELAAHAEEVLAPPMPCHTPHHTRVGGGGRGGERGGAVGGGSCGGGTPTPGMEQTSRGGEGGAKSAQEGAIGKRRTRHSGAGSGVAAEQAAVPSAGKRQRRF